MPINSLSGNRCQVISQVELFEREFHDFLRLHPFPIQELKSFQMNYLQKNII